MYIGVYGTLRRDQRLFYAMATAQFLGKLRMWGEPILLIKTPAGFPAAVRVPGNYFTYLDRKNRRWAGNRGTNIPESRTGRLGGIDYPLVEVYNTAPTLRDTLDMIEGVPHLYTRDPVHLQAVAPNGFDGADNSDYREALMSESKLYPASMRLHTEDILHNNPPARCHSYFMRADSEWIQGCQIIVNGDFVNPIINPDLTFDYVLWQKENSKNVVLSASQLAQNFGIGNARARRPAQIFDEEPDNE